MSTQHNLMPVQSTLLLRPHPYRNEGPKGYLSRLAEANWILPGQLQDVGLMYELGTLVNEGLMPLKELDPDLHRNVWYYSELLFNKKRVWNHQHPRFCPHCLSDDPYWRVEWELLFHDACSVHDTWLVDQCSSCGGKLNWNRESIIRCSCGADLRAEQANKCPESVSRLSGMLKEKISLNNKHSSYVPPFTYTDVEQTQRIIRYLGSYMSLAAGKNPLKIQRAGLMANSWPVTSLAAEILSGWPQAFYQSLEKIQIEVKSSKPTLSTVFGQAYHYLYKGLKGNDFREIKDAFEKWLSSSWKGGLAKRNKRLAEKILENAEWIPGNLACEMLGVSHQRLEFLIRQNVIEAEIYWSEKGRKYVMVRRDSFDIVKGNLSAEIDMKTAGELLGLCKKRMRQLMRMLFPEAQKTGPSNSSPWTVSRFEINKLIDINKGLDRVSIEDEGCVSLNHILRYWAWSTEDLYELINGVRTGDIKPVNILDGIVGIGGWNFNDNNLRAWKLKSQNGLGSWLTITQAAKVIGIKEQVAYEMVNMGFLKAEVMPRQVKRGTRVHRSELVKFKAQYVFATQIAEVLGCSPRKSINNLLKMGINSISGPTADQARQVLYLRTVDLEAALERFLSKGGDNLRLI